MLAPLILALAADPGGADTLCLRDGRVFDGLRLEYAEDGYVVHFEHGDVRVPSGLVLDALVESAPAFQPRTPEEQEKAAQGLVPWDGGWISADARDRLVKKRLSEQRARVAELKAHREWRDRRSEKTKHFLFEYTVALETFEGLRDRMEAYFTSFAKDWGVKQPNELGRLSVAFYGTRKEFHRTSGAGWNVLGYFRFVQPLELDFYYDRLDPALTEDVMFHETNHYLQKLIDVGFSMPHFPGESLAEYYGASEYDPASKEFKTGLIQEGRLVEVQTDILEGQLMGLERLVSSDRIYEHYTWGWSLIHFLMNDAKRAKKFQKFVFDLARGPGVKRVPQGEDLRTVEAPEVWRVFRESQG